MKKIILFASLYFFFQTLTEAQIPTRLRIDLFEYPQIVEITDNTPKFGWIYHSIKNGDFQTAYRVIVASSKNKIDANIGNVWDSNKISSNQSSNVEYRGKDLKARKKYYYL